MTFRGKPATFASAHYDLLKARKSPAAAIMLGCHGHAAYHAPSDEARKVPQFDWSHCPFDLGNEHLRVLNDLRAMARVMPLSNFPQGYAAWVATCLPQ